LPPPRPALAVRIVFLADQRRRANRPPHTAGARGLGAPRVAISTSAGIDLRRTTTGGQRRSSPIVTDSAV